VAIVGAGGIGREIIARLAGWNTEIIAVTRRGRPVEGAASTLPAERTDEVWGVADFIVLAAPATARTRHLVGRDQLAAMRSDAWLINVARGSLVDHDALAGAVRDHEIAGAALDVTEPEPLPDDHPLWQEPRVLITPHVANPPEAVARALRERVRENVERLAAGRDLVGRIDPDAGY
jgi:D-3-phosphoglycerate dehydrogenase